MPAALGSLALFLFQAGGPIWLSNALVGIGTFLGTGLGSALLAAGAIGLRMAMQKKPPAPQPSDVQSNIRQEISARRRIYGRYLTGSIIVFGFRRGEKSYLLHYICEGPITGYISFRLDRKPVTLDAEGFVEQAQYVVGGRSRVQILTTLGTATDEPFAELLASFPELDTPLAPFRHRGCAMMLQIVEQVPQNNLQDTYPNNMPSLQVVIDGYAQVYDPRAGTFGLSDNAGCCLLTETMDVYGLTPADADEIDLASFAVFAAHCDEPISLKAGGAERRYRCCGMISLDAENEARIKAIGDVCNADIYHDPQGRIAVRRKMRSTPGIALRARNGDHLDLQMEGGRGLQKMYNSVKVTYVDPELNYKANEVSWRHYGLIEEDGEEFSEPLGALLCPSPTQAQRLAKLAVHEGNPEFAGKLVSGPQALDLMEDYVFTLDLSPEDDFERVAASVGGIEYDQASMTVSANFVVFHAGATDWNPAVDEQHQVIVPPDLPSYVDDVLLDVAVTVELQTNSAPVIRFAWAAAGSATLPDSYSHQVEVSPTGVDIWSAAVVTQDQNTAIFAAVADGAAYDWRIRNIAAGKTFDWQYSTAPVTVTVDPVAPAALASFALSGAAPRLGHAAFAFVTGNDAHLRSVALYRVAAGAAFNPSAQPPVVRLVASALSTFSYVDGDATRVNQIVNGDFASDTVWTRQTGWSIGSGVASHAAGTASSILQSAALSPGAVYRAGMDVTAISGGASVAMRLDGGAGVQASATGVAGKYLRTLTATADSNQAGARASAAGVVSIDNLVLYPQTTGCAPQGVWDYYAVPLNISGIAGPASGPLPATII